MIHSAATEQVEKVSSLRATVRMSDGSFPRNQGADPGLPGSDTGEPVGQYDCPAPAGEGGEPLQEPRTSGHQVKY